MQLLSISQLATTQCDFEHDLWQISAAGPSLSMFTLKNLVSFWITQNSIHFNCSPNLASYFWLLASFIFVITVASVSLGVFYVGFVRGKLDYISVNPEYYNTDGLCQLLWECFCKLIL